MIVETLDVKTNVTPYRSWSEAKIQIRLNTT